jgi:uncharacterized membrane protein YqjE
MSKVVLAAVRAGMAIVVSAFHVLPMYLGLMALWGDAFFEWPVSRWNAFVFGVLLLTEVVLVLGAWRLSPKPRAAASQTG